MLNMFLFTTLENLNFKCIRLFAPFLSLTHSPWLYLPLLGNFMAFGSHPKDSMLLVRYR